MGQGTFEIERRYLVRVAHDVGEALRGGRSLRQGYVVAGDPSIRIRVGEARGPVLAFKAGKGMVRREVEALVPLDMAEALLEAAGGRVIRKTRYRLGPWELDRYEGPLEGLTLLEIELAGAADPVPPPPIGIDILHEVTEDKRFVGSVLASMNEAEQRSVVERAYREGQP